MKCILLVRVSTEAQSYDEQERELYELALKKGYKPSNIVSIAEKESGIRLSEEERKGLNRMKELLLTGEYNCVLAWEISRIARKKKILFSILDYLVERRIQLIIKEPYLELLNPEGNINEGSETIFTLYAQLAESEMRNKAARMDRGKKNGYNNGKYQGGKIKLGYRIDEKGYWQVDEYGASIIRLIFHLYNTGEYSMTELAQEMKDRGFFPNVNTITNVKCMIWKIIKDDVYRGRRTSNNLFPRIIDDETWAISEKKRKDNRHKGAKKSQRLLSSLIRCECGSCYSANLLDCTYECRTRHNAVEKGFKHSPSININLIESLAWYFSLNELQNDLIEKRESAKITYEKEIEIYKQKISVSQDTIKNIHSRRKDLEDRYFGGSRLSKERFEELIKKTDVNEDKEKLKILEYKSKITNLKRQITLEESFNDMLNGMVISYEELIGGTDIDIMKEIIHRYITEIRIDKLPNLSQYFRKVTFTTNNNRSIPSILSEDLNFIYADTFYVDTYHKKAYFNKEFTNEVPMMYIEREHRKRIDHRHTSNKEH